MLTLIVFLLAHVLLVLTTPLEVSFPVALPTESIQGDEDSCLQYSRCGIQGRFYWTKLVATLASTKSVDKASTLRIFDTYYGALHAMRKNAGQEVEQDLINHGLSPELIQHERWGHYCHFQLPERGYAKEATMVGHRLPDLPPESGTRPRSFRSASGRPCGRGERRGAKRCSIGVRVDWSRYKYR